MAQIKMDMTEYNELQAHKQSLQDALNREKLANDQIKVLQDEKMKVLEEAQNKVVVKKETRRTVHEYRSVPRDLRTIQIALHRIDDAIHYGDEKLVHQILDSVFEKHETWGEPNEHDGSISQSYELSKPLEDWKGEQLELLEARAERSIGEKIQDVPRFSTGTIKS